MSNRRPPSLSNRRKISDFSDPRLADKKRAMLEAFQHEFTMPLTSADQHLQEVRSFVERLKELAAQFEEAGSSHRRQFSLQVQHNALQTEIKKALQIKADVHAQAGLPEEQNLTICQAFVDDVIVYLARSGIRLNPLNVMKVRKNRWA
jgi:hypothetical protein